MVKHYCDRCKKEAQVLYNFRFPFVEMNNKKWDIVRMTGYRVSRDLCGECAIDVVKYANATVGLDDTWTEKEDDK